MQYSALTNWFKRNSWVLPFSNTNKNGEEWWVLKKITNNNDDDNDDDDDDSGDDEKGEPKQIRTEVSLLNSLTPYR